jgi:hypothetical protein
VDSASYRTSRAIADAMKTASPEVNPSPSRCSRRPTSLPGVLAEPNTGAILNSGAKTIRSRIGPSSNRCPGGEEFVRKLPKTTLASHVSGKDSDMYSLQRQVHAEQGAPRHLGVGGLARPNNPQEIDACIHAFLKPNNGQGPGQDR